MRILVATDAWHPQVNGVVRTLAMMAEAAKTLRRRVQFPHPGIVSHLRAAELPGFAAGAAVSGQDRPPDRRGPARQHSYRHRRADRTIGAALLPQAMVCPFTTSFHTRFPEYISARLPVPESWIWAALRWFHAPSQAVMAATPALATELRVARLSQRGAVAARRRRRACFTRATSISGCRARCSCASAASRSKRTSRRFSISICPAAKVIVGDGPARASLARKYPQAVFLGSRQGEALAEAYAGADVFVFPSKTDTFGLVLLEALASGVPVAAFPVTGPRDVIGVAPVGALNDDLAGSVPGRAEDLAAGLPRICRRAYLGSLGARLHRQHGRHPHGRCEQRRAADSRPKQPQPRRLSVKSARRACPPVRGPRYNGPHDPNNLRIRRQFRRYRCRGSRACAVRGADAAVVARPRSTSASAPGCS